MRRRAATRNLRRLLLLATATSAAGLALLLDAGDLLGGLERSTLDTRFTVRGEREPSRDVVVVAIDDVSFEELGERFPFSRKTFARALEKIAADGPRVIVYDVQFTEPSDDEEADNALIDATRAARNVVLSTTEVGPDATTNVFGGIEIQEFARATVGNGLLPEDDGGVLRRLTYDVDGLRALSVAAVERAGLRVDRGELDGEGAWIDYGGAPGHMPTLSFSRAVNGRFEPGTFAGRFVVIGASAPSLQDRHPTSWGGQSMAGPEIHANAIETLLRGVPLRSIPTWLAALITVAMPVITPLAGLRLKPLASLGIAVGLAAAYLVVVQLSFGGGDVLPVAYPLVGLSVGAVGSIVVHYLSATVERAQMRDLFARFVPDAVVSEVLARADAGGLRLGGVRLVSTVMFSDLRGFTQFAENREPEEVIEVLNRYLTLMSDAILDHGGTLVAYMGDGIMAVFGAPIGTDDHADRALGAAREMLARLDEFNAWMRENDFGDGFKMGIGLNTGGVMSGNVGSERRLEYTAIGDTTNTAARLEGMTKGTAHQVYISESTRAALKNVADDLEVVGELEVRGRKEPIRVWALRQER